ncbi:MAG: L,D-transpeptidase family protein [Afipia sp.]|nr:L,D-transpeptidase family protein [Afipia sp.]OJW64514.1 MAG: L,D-transpeptidase [Afipia sp. 64-13]
MRSLWIAVLAVMASVPAAQAAIQIDVNKDLQQMTVSVDNVPRYTWPVSSGNPSHETPNGSFRTFRMEEDHYSKEFDDAPMPHAIFFTKQGHAIHGTDSVGRLGTPVSHGCVRLSRANALTLWNLVKQEGLLNTTVRLTGSSRVALARNPKSRTAVAAREREPLTLAPGSTYDNPGADDSYGNSASQDRTYQNRRPYYSNSADASDQRYPQSQQRRLYPDPRAPGRYIEERDDGYPGYQQYYPGYQAQPRRGYGYYGYD